MESYKCKYCGKICKKSGVKNHERFCKLNPNRIDSPIVSYNKNKRHPWNKGLTKETDERVRKNGESIKESYKSGKVKSWCDGLTKETDERLKRLSKNVSNTVKEKVENDNWHSSLGKIHHYKCNNVTLHGKWELAFAEYLNMRHIKWERPKDKFKYFFQNEWHYYHPDFYLSEYDVFIEIKGCITEKDIAKWSQFPNDKKLDIYFGDDLKELNIVNDAKTKCNDEMLNKINQFHNKNLNLEIL